MPTLTIVLPDTLAERLRKTVRERYAGKKGSMSRIIAEALDAYMGRSESSSRSEKFQALKGKRIIAEASSLDELGRQLREKGLTLRNLRIISSKRLAPVAKAGLRAKPV